MKANFKLEHANKKPSSYWLRIIGQSPKNKPYVVIEDDVVQFYIADDELEKVAINILKALKSKHLKP